MVNATPRAVAFALDTYVKKRGLTSEGRGFHKDIGERWSAGIGPYKGPQGWRQLIADPLNDGKTSLLFCEIQSSRIAPVGGMTFEGRPPDMESLFNVKANPVPKP